MISQDAWNLELGFHAQKPIQLEPVQEHLSTDTGLLLFRQLDWDRHRKGSRFRQGSGDQEAVAG